MKILFSWIPSFIRQYTVEFREMKLDKISNQRNTLGYFTTQKKLIQIQITFLKKACSILANYMPPMCVSV